jgi:succinate-semialdehyde dehydrogenase/glutarate-semialdehyde dehydrogenase
LTPITVPTLHDATLLREQLHLDGAWVDGAGGDRADVIDPATGSVIASVAQGTRDDARQALASAQRGLAVWSAITAPARATLMRRWFDLIVEAADDLAMLLTAEQGKPLAESRGEILYGAGFIEWFAEEGKRAYGEVIPSNFPNRQLLTLRQPIGVCTAITPWNFPMAMIARKVAPALAAGCSMVVKPAPATPLSALAMAELADRAGIPAGELNIIPGPAGEVGHELATNPIVRKLTFTGSTATGRLLAEQAAATVKRVSLELGGNAPFIVFDDADLGAAVAGAMVSKFRNSGQTCVCANRILVQSGIHDAFVAALVEAVAELHVANGFEPGAEQGPLIDERAVEKVRSHIADAVAHGAEVRVGGDVHELGGTFFTPTVLAGVTATMRVSVEETFGPVAAVLRFDTEAQALALANDTESGLAAYLFTRDLSRATRMGAGLEFGVVGINTGLISYEGAPFGGTKQSGLGREGSRHGLEDYFEIKYLCLQF